MPDNVFIDAALAASPELHVVLENSFNGRGSADPAQVTRFFDPGFRIVSPTGKTMGFETSSGALPALRGSRPGLVMEISAIELIHAEADSAVVSYVERQIQGDSDTRRLSTVLLVRGADGLKWKHLQETWRA